MWRPDTPGKWGWLGVASVVIAADGRALARHHPTMSAEFRNHRMFAVAVWGFLTLHLVEILPPKWDPLRRWFPPSA